MKVIVGLTLLALGVLMFIAWGISSALILQQWNPINGDSVLTCFGYAGVIFKFPTLIALALGLVFLVLGLRSSNLGDSN